MLHKLPYPPTSISQCLKSPSSVISDDNKQSYLHHDRSRGPSPVLNLTKVEESAETRLDGSRRDENRLPSEERSMNGDRLMQNDRNNEDRSLHGGDRSIDRTTNIGDDERLSEMDDDDMDKDECEYWKLC